MALFMVIGLITLNFTGLTEHTGQGQDHILGGPAAEGEGASLGAHTPGDSLGVAFAVRGVDNNGISLESIEKQGQNDFAVAAVRDLGGLVEGTNSLTKTPTTYKTKAGDTLTDIAANYGISLDTLIQANPALQKGSLKAGQTLTILPVSGILYTVAKNDTLSGIASTYRIEASKIVEFNDSIKEGGDLAVGTKLILPGAKQRGGSTSAASTGSKVTASLASSGSNSGYFIQPTTGFNWGILHGHNGVDIANNLGTPVLAAADGLVIPDSVCQMDSGWNGGYGTCILLQHPNGMTTLYGHLGKTSVELGDYVKQGQVIGLMGNTGKSTGPHLHFEVRGGTNPFAR